MNCLPQSLFARALAATSSVALALVSFTPAQAVILEFGTSGRFIAITNNGGVSRQLHVGELEAFTTGAYVSSTSLEPAYDKARTTMGASFESQIGTTAHGSNTAPLDAIRNTGAAVFTLNAGVGVQMVYDLGTTRNLSAIKLWQRADGCCQDRLSNFTVSVMADNAGVPGAPVFSQSFPGQVATDSFTELNTLTSRQVQPGNVGVIGTDVVGESAARFIRVRNNVDGARLLHIGEFETFQIGVTPNNATDLSTNEIAGDSFESSFGPVAHGVSSALVNDVRDVGSAVYTLNTAAGNEMVVDLGADFDIGAVRLWQRNDGCCQERLSNFTVSVLKDNGAGLPGDEVFAFNHTGQAATNSFAQINVPVIPDAFTLQSIDTLVIDIDPGTITGDLLRVGSLGNGALTIQPGADLVLNFLNDDFDFGLSETYNILDFASVTGSFSSITAVGLDDRVLLDTSNLLVNGTITLTATPEPASLVLWIGLGVVLCAFGMRKKLQK